MRSHLFTIAFLGLIALDSPQVSAQSAPTEQTSPSMHQAMKSGMEKMQALQMTGNTDKDFAMMMRMHHQQAVEMARAEVQHGKSPELKAMAQKMITDQQKEIAQLDQWLAKNK
jgi:uncharacterized protein (DUF305 family)